MKGKRFIACLALLSILIALFIPLTAAAGECMSGNPLCDEEAPPTDPEEEQEDPVPPPEQTQEEERLTDLEEQLDPVLPPEQTQEEERLTDLEEQLDPVVPPAPIQEEASLPELEEEQMDPVLPPAPTQEEERLTDLEEQLEPVLPPEPTQEAVSPADSMLALRLLDPDFDRPFDCFMQRGPKGRASCPIFFPDVWNFNETIEPEGITWGPAVDWPLALIFDYETGEIVQETNAAQYRIDPGSYGLCGTTAQGGFLRAEYPDTTAGWVADLYDSCMEDYDPDPNYTSADNLAEFMNTCLGEFVSAEAVNLTDNGPSNDEIRLQLATDLREYLQDGAYIILGLEIESGSQYSENAGRIGFTPGPGDPIGHWVGFMGMSEQWDFSSDSSLKWVRINNPFDNQYEYYSWRYFENIWSTSDWNHELVVMRFRRVPDYPQVVLPPATDPFHCDPPCDVPTTEPGVCVSGSHTPSDEAEPAWRSRDIPH